MSQENVQDIASLVEAVNRRDRDRLGRVLHPEFEFHALIGSVEQRVYSGSGGMWAFIGDMDTTWDGYRIKLEEVHEAGERAVAVLRIYGTARLSGIPLNQDLAQVVTSREGKLIRVDAYSNRAEALEAVGLES